MTMETHVFSQRRLLSIADWQQSIDALGFGLTLQSDRDVTVERGHLPAIWNGREAGFECGPTDVFGLIAAYEEIDFGGPWAQAYAFYWGTLPGCVGAVMAAAAYAHATGGVVFDPEEGILLDADAALQQARDTAASLPGMEAFLDGLSNKL